MRLANSALWSVIGCIFGIYLFARGFLLSRRELLFVNDSTELTPNYGGAVLLLVDALGFDFMDPTRKVAEGAWAGNLDYMRRFLDRNPNHSRIFHFKADPPTTTLQRLKGLTTGSFPTFIDVSQNFDGATVTEDNLMLQLARSDRSVFFTGDDTWMSLFPRSLFSKVFPYPSFDVMDLDSVDAGVRTHFSEELYNTSKWPDVAIGHLLGVDHCGHRFGPDHPEMRRKLREVDALVSELLQQLPKDRLLLVFGDHGMTTSGDHGGDSPRELDAGLFVFSPHGLLPGDNGAEMDQVDLVPTLAALLGLPIPFSSLGRVRPEFFPNRSIAAASVRANLRQVGAYIDSYQEAFADLSEEALAQFKDEQRRLLSNANDSAVLTGGSRWLSSVQTFFRAKWTRFDLVDIVCGLLAFTFAAVRFLSISLTASWLLPVSCLPVLLRCGWLAPIALLLPLQQLLRALLPVRKCLPPMEVLPLCAIFGGACVIAFSNSFVVHEGLALNFLLQSFLLGVALRASWPPSSGSARALFGAFLLASVTLRCGLEFASCREEQLPGCKTNLFALPIEKLPQESLRLRSWRFLCAFIGLALLLFVHRFWLRSRGHFRGLRPAVLAARLLLPLAAFAAAAAFFLRCLPAARLTRMTQRFLLLPARLALTLPVLGLLLLLLRPLAIFLSSGEVEEDTLAAEVSGPQVPGVVPLLWRHLKKSYGQRSVTGLPSLFTASFSIFYAFSLVLCLILLGDGFLFNLMGLFVVCAATTAIVRHINLDRDLLVGMLFALIGHFYFYAQGHQPTFANIPWHAAFVGFSGNHQSYWLPTLFVWLNLFCSFLLTALCLPLTLVSEFSGGGQWMPLLWTTSATNPPPRGELAVVDAESEFLTRLRVRYGRLFFCSICLALTSMVAAAHHRRHLMVWKIFAPKMMFTVVSLSGTVVGIGLGYLLTVRICQSFRAWQDSLSE